jgi:hypothetical protein
MKKVVIGIIAGLAIGIVATRLMLHPGAAPAKAAAPAAPAEKPKENPLHLNAAKREKTGVTLAKPTTATLAPEVTAFGRVIDTAPFAVLVAELETARAAQSASEKDAARVKKLFEAGGNASAQAVEAAEAAAARDHAALASARARLIAGWGRKLADDADLGLLVDALEKGGAVARIDLLPGDAPAAELKKISVGLLGGAEMFDAEILGPALVADPQMGGVGFLASIKGRTLPVGAALRATLAGPGDAAAALIVPRGAVVYHQGSAWIFVLGEEDTFERKVVTLGRTVGDGVVIASGLEENEQVAVTGAGQLLSAELQAGGAPEEP